MKHLAILGSTGSIGTSALSVVESFPGRFDAVALAAGHNVAKLREQVRAFHPEVVSVANAGAVAALADEFPEVRWVHGAEGLIEVACHPSADVVIGAVVGSAGLAPTLAAIRAGKDIALANKETLVVAGDLVIEAARKHGVRLLPIDSEHNAIHQALRVGPPNGVKRLILTASGGPFRTWSPERIRRATVEDALAHPTWKMGRKISIDSATMMNKALEVIEAHHLFEMPSERISVLIHPQSLVHSFVEYIDGTLIAQLSVNDMRFPILYALAYPDRLPTPFAPLDLASAPALQFEEPDPARFPALELARTALDEGGEIPAVLNGANEAAVAAFLDRRLPFGAIIEITARVIDCWIPKNRPLASVEQALAADHEARSLAAGLLAKYETLS